MARHLTISAFSLIPTPPAPGRDVLDHMIEFWKKQIQRVLPDRPDLIVLPEICDRCDDAIDRAEYLAYCDHRGSRFRDALADIARKHRTFITCPTLRRADDRTWRNSVELIDRNGDIAGIYDKNHLTVSEIEMGIRPGDAAPVFETELGRVACAICFDLNFDELRLQYVRQKPELILFSSAYHGGLMQAYWAYSCRSHFVGAIGKLPSEILSPVGHRIAASTNYFPLVTAQINLDCRVFHLDHHLKKLDEIKAKYGRDVTLFDPGLLAPILLTSESTRLTIDDIVREFNMEPLDDYLDRSRKVRADALER
jgi:hypothetical protein